MSRMLGYIDFQSYTKYSFILLSEMQNPTFFFFF